MESIHDDADMSNFPTIPEYFKGKSIFVTGGSGFMGQALVEKLLYSCPELDRIYLLLRKKKGVPPEERLEKVYSSTCFNRLKEQKPFIFKEKVFIISGDLLDSGLGLSMDDRALLSNKIDIVFNVAASVRFDDPLPYAAKLNIRGTKEVMELAKQMRNLKSFVHVSTCFCNFTPEVIDEMLYEPLADWRKVLEICESVDDIDMTLQAITPKYLNGLPNTYVFTKHLAEHMVNEERGELPIVIVRPSVVVPSVDEPSPGWSNSFSGIMALSIPVGLGIKRSLYGTEDAVLHLVPLDVCIKSFIVLAWATGTGRVQYADVLSIYNCCAKDEDSIKLKEFVTTLIHLTKTVYPFNYIMWDVKTPVITNVLLYHRILTLLFSILPALLIDFIILMFVDKKFSLLKIQKQIYRADLSLNAFMSRKWSMANNNFLKIRELIRPEDRNSFYYKSEGLYASDYLEKCVLGTKKYLMKEDLNDLEKAKKFTFRMKILDRTVSILFYSCIFWYFSKYFWNFFSLREDQ